MTDNNAIPVFPEPIIAFDCASKTCSAAVYADGRILCEINTNTDSTHSLTLLPSAEAALSICGLTPDKIGGVAVTVGPGSFTGLKIGVSTAKGMAFPRSLPCWGVSSMAALAYGYRAFTGIVCTSFDARRGMLYNAVFKAENGMLTRLCEDRQSPAADIAAELRKYAGESGERHILLCGDGAGILTALPETPYCTADVSGIRASSVIYAVLAGEGNKCSSATLVPEYLRPSQAERERAERLAAK